MLKAHPQVLGLQKLRTTKLNTKGRTERERASDPLSGARPLCSPGLAMGFISLSPSQSEHTSGESQQLPPGPSAL